MLLLLVLLPALPPELELARPHRPDLRYVTFDEAGVADAGGGRAAHVARAMLDAAEADAFARAVRGFEANASKLDSTDGLPAYELYIRHQGVDTHPAAASLPALEARMGAFMAERYGCARCHVCSVLLRRYLATERVKVPSHFDRMAYVTAVASLNPSQFDGGLYLQRTARSDSREFFSVGGRDLVFHQYDLNHGVELHDGVRYSVVLWVSDTRKSCAADTSPWYVKPAMAGDMDAQDALAELHQLGQHGYERDADAAAEWAEKAAEQGSAASQSRLGRMLLAGEGVPRDKARGLAWVRKAAEQGHAPAEHTMGVACQYGDEKGGLEAAARWFGLSAAVGVAASQYELGVAYVNGDGVAKDIVRGVGLLRKAVAQGHREAASDLEAMEAMSAQRNSTLAEDVAAIEAEAAAAAEAAERQRVQEGAVLRDEV